MSLKIGDPAPAFDVTATGGRRLRLEDFKGKQNVVLFFYPGDFTAVCTAEACGFRDMYEELRGKDTEIIGVSIDDDERHQKFASHHRLAFPLVADPERKLARTYAAGGGFNALRGKAQRITYVIGKDTKIRGVFDSALFAKRHLEGVRETLAKL